MLSTKVGAIVSMFTLLLLLLNPSTCVARLDVRYHWSGNHQHGVSIVTGTNDDSAHATILAYDRPKRRYAALTSVPLPHRYMPIETVVTNNGRYCVTLGDFSGNRDLKSEIVIIDVMTGKQKSFSLNAIYPTEQLREKYTYAPQPPIYRMWFQTGSTVVDDDAEKIYLTGIHRSRDRRQLAPTIVIDLKSMTVQRPSRSFWNEKHDEQMLRFYEMRERFGRTTATAEDRWFYEYAFYHQRKPGIQHVGIGLDFLFRITPGSAETNAEMLMFKRDAKTGDFLQVKTIRLKNPVMPSQMFISPNAKYMITVDEHDTMGSTKNALVMYDLQTGSSRAFALEDFCSENDLREIQVRGDFRCWRMWKPWLKLAGKDIDGWGVDTPVSGMTPHILVDFDEMSVQLVAPFRRKQTSAVAK